MRSLRLNLKKNRRKKKMMLVGTQTKEVSVSVDNDDIVKAFCKIVNIPNVIDWRYEVFYKDEDNVEVDGIYEVIEEKKNDCEAIRYRYELITDDSEKISLFLILRNNRHIRYGLKSAQD